MANKIYEDFFDDVDNDIISVLDEPDDITINKLPITLEIFFNNNRFDDLKDTKKEQIRKQLSYMVSTHKLFTKSDDFEIVGDIKRTSISEENITGIRCFVDIKAKNIFVVDHFIQCVFNYFQKYTNSRILSNVQFTIEDNSYDVECCEDSDTMLYYYEDLYNLATALNIPKGNIGTVAQKHKFVIPAEATYSELVSVKKFQDKKAIFDIEKACEIGIIRSGLCRLSDDNESSIDNVDRNVEMFNNLVQWSKGKYAYIRRSEAQQGSLLIRIFYSDTFVYKDNEYTVKIIISRKRLGQEVQTLETVQKMYELFQKNIEDTGITF